MKKLTIFMICSGLISAFIWFKIYQHSPKDLHNVAVACRCDLYWSKTAQDTCYYKHVLGFKLKTINDTVYYSIDGIYYIKYRP